MSYDDCSVPKNDGKYQLFLFKKLVKTCDSLRVGLFNIRSMWNKMGRVVEILNKQNLDILCITETWLLDSDISIIWAALPRTHVLLYVS